MALTQAKPEAMSRDVFHKSMLDRLAKDPHYKYPIFQAIAKGTATRGQIGYLAIVYYHFTKWTPQIISSIHARCEDRVIRRRIMDTLIDEDTELRCGSKSHDMLAMDFATYFTGWTEDDVENFDVPQWHKDLIAYRFKVAREFPVTIALGNSGIAAEAKAVEWFKATSDGLRQHYGVKDEDQESWIVHIDGDEEHSGTAFKVVLDFATTVEHQQMMLWCIDEYSRHLGNLFRACETSSVDIRK